MRAEIIAAGAEPPREIPAHVLYGIDAGALGPDAYRVDGILDAAKRIYLFEKGTPLDLGGLAATMSEGIGVLICATAFRAWFQHIERLGLRGRLFAASVSGDPQRRLH